MPHASANSPRLNSRCAGYARGSLAVVPFLIVLALAWPGVDFGYHWDENYDKIDAVVYSLNHDSTLLPNGYLYPGVNYWLTVGMLAPEIWQTARRAGPNAQAFRDALLPVVTSYEFHLRFRRAIGFFVALTAVWIYLVLLVWGRGVGEALAGSVLFASSWEVLYHARWIAPDPVMMQFGMLSFLLVSLAWQRQSTWALRAAAVAAGFACGTKYPGALVLLPVLLAPFLQERAGEGLGRKVLRATGLGGIFFITYLITTPGTVLEPVKFIQTISIGVQVYSSGWFGYTVAPGWDHFEKLVQYFSVSAFSAFPAVSGIFFTLAMLGAWAVARESRAAAVLIFSFPVAYTLYFISQSALVVRNYLVLFPFAAFFAARGIGWVSERLPSRPAKAVLASAVALLLAVNLVDQFRATDSIVHRRDSGRFVQDLVRYAAARPQRMLLVSNRVRDALQQNGAWPKPNIVALDAGAKQPFDEYVSYYSETVIPRQHLWPANQPGIFAAVFGPREVNLDYYPGWAGPDHMVAISADTTRDFGLVPVTPP